jgi:uncharacterized protein
MKKLLTTLFFFALIPFVTSAYTSPGSPQGFVNDFAKVLSPADVQSLEAKLVALEQATGAEVAVVTIATHGDDETIETYAEKLFQEWGIGKEKQDTGLLLIVAIDDREVRIETGYGLEGAVTDIQSGNIIRNVMVPAFKNGAYAEGIIGAVNALDGVIRKSPEAAQYSQEPKKGSVSFEPFIFVFLFLFNAIAHILGKSKSWWLGGVLGAFFGAIVGMIWGFVTTGFIAIGVLTVLGLALDYFVSHRPPGSRGHGGWPMIFGGGKHGGGGFGGFGGGSSGGGGASGRW